MRPYLELPMTCITAAQTLKFVSCLENKCQAWPVLKLSLCAGLCPFVWPQHCLKLTFISDTLLPRGKRSTSPHLSPVLYSSTASHQSCVPSPLLYSTLLYTLFTHGYTHTHLNNKIIKFVDDTTTVVFISGCDATLYRLQVEWCQAGTIQLTSGITFQWWAECLF